MAVPPGVAEADGGRASSTTGGTVKRPSLTCAVQVNDTLIVPDVLKP